MIRTIAILAVVAGFVLAASPVIAHHGVGPYDMDHSTSVKGTITQFDFVNPHAQIYVDAKDDKGNIQKWVIECGSPNMMHRNGWNKVTVKPGDQGTFLGHASKDGSKSMRLEKIVWPNGQELFPEKAVD